MKVLITNVEMDGYSGTTLYVKELAFGLRKIGLQVEVYTMRVGPIGQELQASNILVTTRLRGLSTPDIVHCHHNITAGPILSRFSKTPMIFWIHNRLSPLDIPPKHRNIVQYMAVDFNCQERYVTEHNIMPESVGVIHNWVNLERFKKKSFPNSGLKKALIFSNYATEQGYIPIIRSACERLGITLEVMGQGTGSLQLAPEKFLGDYDLIFAKAKAAMEAMACGCAVVVCDFTGLAGLVTSNNFDEFRRLNFGMKLMTRPIQVDDIVNELEKYTPEDITKVSNRIRVTADMNLCIEQIHALYTKVIEKYKLGNRGNYSFQMRNYLGWRRATFRIWIGLWFNIHLPFIHTVFKKLGGNG